MDFKVEWVQINKQAVPVVRLAEMDKLIQEAEWAMERLSHMIYDRALWHADKDPSYRRAQAFLASVAAWRTGQRNCPTCDSPQPHLHPAMQHGGEVQPCTDPWHGRKGQEGASE